MFRLGSRTGFRDGGSTVGVLTADDVRAAVERAATSPLALLENVLHLCRRDADTLVELFAEPAPASPTPATSTAGAAPTTAGRAASTEAGAQALARRRERHVLALRQMADNAAVFFAGGIWPTVEEIDDFVVDLQRRFAPAEPALVPRALALALDEQARDLIRAEFDLHENGTVLNDRVFPLPPADLLDAYARKFGHTVSLTPQLAHTHSAVFNIDSTLHFRLCTPPAGMTVHALTGFTDELDVLDRIPEVATVAPLGATDARTAPKPTATGSFGHGPVDEAAAWDATIAMLAKAAAGDIEVAVVPELNLGPNVTPDLSGQTVPALVLCGSQHKVTPEGMQVNEATLHVNGTLALTHDKMHPLQDLTNASHAEDIVCGRRIELLFSRYWTVGVLVCADVNLPLVTRLVEDLGVNLLLVASMTTKPGFFEAALRSICERNQALVVWANDPVKAIKVDTSMFIFPSRHRAVVARRVALPRTTRHSWRRH